MQLTDIQSMISNGESEALEYKKGTGQLKPAAQTLCAFLNADGGRVIFGITPEEGKVVGQQVSDKTRKAIACELKKFEPPAPIEPEYIPLMDSDRELIVLRAAPARESRPFTFDGRAYHRVETTTWIMPQEMYEQLLLAGL